MGRKRRAMGNAPTCISKVEAPQSMHRTTRLLHETIDRWSVGGKELKGCISHDDICAWLGEQDGGSTVDTAVIHSLCDEVRLSMRLNKEGKIQTHQFDDWFEDQWAGGTSAELFDPWIKTLKWRESSNLDGKL